MPFVRPALPQVGAISPKAGRFGRLTAVIPRENVTDTRTSLLASVGEPVVSGLKAYLGVEEQARTDFLAAARTDADNQSRAFGDEVTADALNVVGLDANENWLAKQRARLEDKQAELLGAAALSDMSDVERGALTAALTLQNQSTYARLNVHMVQQARTARGMSLSAAVASHEQLLSSAPPSLMPAALVGYVSKITEEEQFLNPQEVATVAPVIRAKLDAMLGSIVSSTLEGDDINRIQNAKEHIAAFETVSVPGTEEDGVTQKALQAAREKVRGAVDKDHVADLVTRNYTAPELNNIQAGKEPVAPDFAAIRAELERVEDERIVGPTMQGIEEAYRLALVTHTGQVRAQYKSAEEKAMDVKVDATSGKVLNPITPADTSMLSADEAEKIHSVRSITIRRAVEGYRPDSDPGWQVKADRLGDEDLLDVTATDLLNEWGDHLSTDAMTALEEERQRVNNTADTLLAKNERTRQIKAATDEQKTRRAHFKTYELSRIDGAIGDKTGSAVKVTEGRVDGLKKDARAWANREYRRIEQSGVEITDAMAAEIVDRALLQLSVDDKIVIGADLTKHDFGIPGLGDDDDKDVLGLKAIPARERLDLLDLFTQNFPVDDDGSVDTQAFAPWATRFLEQTNAKDRLAPVEEDVDDGLVNMDRFYLTPERRVRLIAAINKSWGVEDLTQDIPDEIVVEEWRRHLYSGGL